jgi:tetratricopeptide (TPR) repeat protein
VGRIEEAADLLREVLEVARAYYHIQRGWGSRLNEGLWSGRLGEALFRLGRPQEAQAYHELALYISRVENEERWQVRHLCNLGKVHRVVGNGSAALEALRDGLCLAARTGNRHGEGFCAAGLAEVLHEAGQFDEARGLYERGLKLGLPPSNGLCAAKLGILLQQVGRTGEASECFARALAMCDALLAKTPRLVEVLYQRGLAQLGNGHSEVALANYQEAGRICPARGLVQDALLDVRLLQRACPTTPGLGEVVEFLQGLVVEQ